MPKIETPEQAAEILREAKFDGRDDWQPHTSRFGNTVMSLRGTRQSSMGVDFALAIAQGIVDARELAEVCAEAKRLDGYICDLQNRFIPDGDMGLEEKLESLTQSDSLMRSELARCGRILARIIDDLPVSRDWLDPAVEREAVELANAYEGKE